MTRKPNNSKFSVNIIWLLAIVTSIGAVVSMYFSFAGVLSGVSGAFSDLTIFVSTMLVSYLFTNNSERARFEEEMQRLANFSRRRLDLMTANIEALSNELPEIDDLKEMHRLVAFTLRNLAADSGASLKEIEEMGYVESEDPPKPTTRQIALPRREEHAPSGSTFDPNEETDITFNCTNCGIANTTGLRQSAGTTKVVECKNCGMDLNVHRLGDGNTKVVSRWSNRASGVGRSSPSGLSYHLSAPFARVLTPRSQNANCPRCGNLIHFVGKSTRVLDDRFCDRCMSNVIHNQETGDITLGPRYNKRYIESMPSGTFDCECGHAFSPNFLKNDEGKPYFVCFSCHTIYQDVSDEKTESKVICPTEGCSNTLTFKVSSKTQTGKQICYECEKRLEYDVKSGEVIEIEALEIPKVFRENWIESGMLCPTCKTPAGSVTLSNLAGRKFHMHWDCKYPFEIIE